MYKLVSVWKCELLYNTGNSVSKENHATENVLHWVQHSKFKMIENKNKINFVL